MCLNNARAAVRENTRRSFFLGKFSISALFLTGAVAFTPIASGQVQQDSRIVVTGEPIATPTVNPDDFKAKLDHIMKEVDGTQITVTKKATVIKLDKQPPVQNNNNQELFLKAPGLVVSEQQNPGQFNYSYRGLGNPQESEYTMFLQDGLPLMSDWIGFPTLYYQPFPQTVSEIQFIRGGSSLLYGPEPAPAVNFVTKHPAPGSPWSYYAEGVGGSDGFYSGYASVQEATGPLEMRIDGGFTHSDGQRDNGNYQIWQTDAYFGYRLAEKHLLGVDVHISRFSGGDPGRLTFPQFEDDPNFSSTPYNHNWVDRYTVVPHYEVEFGDGWLLQAKGWYTHQDIDARSVNPAGPSPSTTFGYEEFNNGGFDLRLRKSWGDGTMFKGSALTFGGLVYHGDAPFTRYLLNSTNFGPDFRFAPRDSTSSNQTLNQDRESDYQAFFIENIFRIGKFHIVPSFRLDHESVDVDTAVGVNAGHRDTDKTIPLWGIGLGNDFGHLNETYFSASTGWRPVRYFDVGSPFQRLRPDNDPDPFKSLDVELGVHGTPIKGLWYDVGLFWMEFKDRTESQPFVDPESGAVNFLIVNSGNSRHRGFEGEISYDFLAPFQHPILPESEPKDAKSFSDSKRMVMEKPQEVYHPLQLIVFSNLQLLDAEFTESDVLPVGNTPAFAPDVLWKGGISFRKERCFDITLSGVYVSEQFWADANTGTGTIPAKIPDYTVFNLSAYFYVTPHVRVFGGIYNLADEKYYSRVFFNGSIEPAPGRSGFAGVSVEF